MALAVLGLSLVACGHGGAPRTAGTTTTRASTSGTSSPGSSPTITIANFAFGQPLTVAPSATVRVLNTDSAPHNIIATDDSFRTRNVTKGQTTTFVAPSAPGSYEYICSIHPRMHGTLIVAATAASTGRSGGPAAPTSGHGPGATTPGGHGGH